MATKSKYQIIIGTGGGSKSFRYFDATKDKAKEAACVLATDSVNEIIRNNSYRLLSSFKAPRTIKVVEYDNEKKRPKKDGQQFKLHKTSISASLGSGRKIKNEWYEAVD